MKKLYTKLILPPEGTPKLYGFDNEEDRKLFEELLRIPKVGAKVALSMISHFSLDEIVEIVESNDAKRLSRVPGLGKKLSERVILELRGRLKVKKGNLPVDLVEALESLGYKRREIFKAISDSNINFEGLPIEEAIKKAIKVISGGKG
jgi:Holliday junction DNA helicase RuvA